MKKRLPAILAIGTMLWTGCGGDDSKKSQQNGTNNGEATYTEVWNNVFSNCARSCHSPGEAPLGGPDFSTKELFYQNSVGKKPQDNGSIFWNNIPVGCRTLKFVEPGKPERSLIAGIINKENMEKMDQNLDCRPNYSSHLLKVGHPDADQQARILSWIRAGAPDN